MSIIFIQTIQKNHSHIHYASFVAFRAKIGQLFPSQSVFNRCFGQIASRFDKITFLKETQMVISDYIIDLSLLSRGQMKRYEHNHNHDIR